MRKLKLDIETLAVDSFTPAVARAGLGTAHAYQADTVRIGADTVRYDADTVRYDADTVRIAADTVYVDADTVYRDADTVAIGTQYVHQC